MIVYLDASALVKRYVAEANSQAVTSLIIQRPTLSALPPLVVPKWQQRSAKRRV